MEIDGHPTQDLVEELEHRGAVKIDGAASGPDPDALRFLSERAGDIKGSWLFLPSATYNTGFDELPG